MRGFIGSRIRLICGNLTDESVSDGSDVFSDLLSIGSAAGVALMGTAQGKYTFLSHLKWTPILAIGYAAAIAAHFMVNKHLMGVGIH